jgi:8-oxo-dGTP pyrophosphatase MutT (NUDIX family)
MQAESLRYTICFCHCGDRILMLYRSNAPNRQRWNGLGGNIEPGETPLACVQREILEEAEIDLSMAYHLHYAGIVTWNVGSDLLSPTGGMYAFIADLPPDWPVCKNLYQLPPRNDKHGRQDRAHEAVGYVFAQPAAN